MAEMPVLADYVRPIVNLFEQFKQHRIEHCAAKQGRPFTYTEEMFIVFFMLMQFRRIHTHKAKWRWLTKHPEMLEMLGWSQAPHRTTIGRRYKALYEVVQEFILFIGQYAPELEERCRHFFWPPFWILGKYAASILIRQGLSGKLQK